MSGAPYASWMPQIMRKSIATILLASVIAVSTTLLPGRLRAATADAVDVPASRTYFGFTAFPYDMTIEAFLKTHQTVVDNSTVYALHFDDGIPWKELLADAPFPKHFQKDWDDAAHGIPKGMKVYVGLAPLDKDRHSLAPATGDAKRLPMPAELRSAPLDDPKLEAAYLAYARRAVQLFKPDFLNIGIESGSPMMLRDPPRWKQFEALYDHVRTAIKLEFPRVQVGISFNLGCLRGDAESRAAKSLVEKSDYIGLSFYPSASSFDEQYGAKPYGAGANAWRDPLAWVRAYTTKPIALSETGYTTRDLTLKAFHIDIKGGAVLQAEYVKDLFALAKQDHYAFVIWFLPIDYDKLYAKMPPGSDVMKLWENIGLIDGDLKPKPSWEIWKAGLAASRN
jgi:hypothetical protein